MFKTGYTNIVNIDISGVVIEQMKKSHKDYDMIWRKMDATKMEFSDESFTVVLDKGSLDAILSEETEESQIALQYFNEVKRVLKKGGRFVIVSLLQEHILRTLLNYFPANDFLFRIIRCFEAEEKTSCNNEDKSSMPVFVVVLTKFTQLPIKIFEFSNDGETIERLKDANEITNGVLNIQRASMIRNGVVRKNSVDEEINFDLFKPNDKTPRYSLYILDQKSSKNLKEYAAFVVPQGRETEWLFATKQGRRKLLESAQHLRLAIVVTHRNQSYKSLDDIKNELNDTVKSFAPKGLKDMSKIPFLSLGNDVGSRSIIFSGISNFSGEFVVEDVQSDESTYRRLIFMNNQFVIQSEALVKKFKKKTIIDHTHLSCEHHVFMILGMLMAAQKSQNKHSLIVGVGGGNLMMYIYNYLKNIKLTCIEIDPEIVKTAKQYFGLVEDEKRLQIKIDDGLEFLKASNETFSSILFDVSSSNGETPPKEFLDDDILTKVKACLPNDGIFILNFVTRDPEKRRETIEKMENIFPSIFSYKLVEDVNEVFYCFLQKIDDFDNMIIDAGKKLNSIKSETVDLNDLCKNLKL
jgi:spermidine synthase